MATSAQLQQKLSKYASGNIPGKIESAIKSAYEPTVKSLINEGQTLRQQAYPSFFQAFDTIGTGAGDLSPAGALSAAMSKGEATMSPYNVNRGLREYYGTTVNDLVGKGVQAYQMGYGNLKDMYGMQYQREQDARRGSGGGSGGGGIDLSSLFGLLNGGSGKPDKKRVALVNEIDKGLESLRGGDGKVAPQTYSYFRNLWASQGNKPELFDQEWGQYVNPNNANYGDYLKLGNMVDPRVKQLPANLVNSQLSQWIK